MKRIVLFVDDIMVLMDCGLSSAYKDMRLIRRLYPDSASLPTGRVLVRDFAHRHGIPLEDIWAVLQPPKGD